MLRIPNIPLPLDYTEDILRIQAAKALRIPAIKNSYTSAFDAV